jgi:transposase
MSAFLAIEWEQLESSSKETIKQVVFPICAGYSQAEIANRLKVHESILSRRMAALRKDILGQL